MDSHGSEQPVIDAIDALIDESMVGGETYDAEYDTCPQCHHQWHGLACYCGCTSNVQSEQSIKVLDDAGARPDWIGGPAGTNIVTVHGAFADLGEMQSYTWRERQHVAIRMPNGDAVTMSGTDYHDVLQRARQVIASIYEVMNTLVGMQICEPPQTDADVEAILFANSAQQRHDSGLWVPFRCDESHCYCEDPNQCRWHR